MWYLVIITVMFSSSSGDYEPIIRGWYQYETIEECVTARAILGKSQSGHIGLFTKGNNAVCVYKDINL